ncbi:MAG: DegT/DnrJ/EryC1/StrS family aminotransferase [Deltaproteobacteria bacterium]|nr:DegT/DnrJ/EryC1/StrS family aminotransferase [Deltaproteobacteria bacterium]
MGESREIHWWQPETGLDEIQLVQDVIESNYLNDGDVTTRFEQLIAARLDVPYAVAVTSGTTALYLSLMALGIGSGDEVIVPDVTFIATANAVTMTGAKAVLVDVVPEFLSMDPMAFERAISKKTRAVIPVHVSGRGGSLLEVMAVAQKYNLPVVEDAAEALLSRFHGRCLGTFGATGCFSFSPNKTITTGQGGIIVTHDRIIHNRLRELKDQGRPVRGTGGDDVHASIGFNFKLTNLQAAVGLGQITYLDRRIERQKRIYELYRDELQETRGISVFPFNTQEGEVPQWTDALAERRDELDTYLSIQGACCRRYWYPIHTQQPYKEPDDRFPNSTRFIPKAIWLPSAFQLTDDDVRYVCDLIRNFYK